MKITGGTLLLDARRNREDSNREFAFHRRGLLIRTYH